MTRSGSTSTPRTRRVWIALVALVAVAAFLAACSSSGGSLTGTTWQLTSITVKVPPFQGVVPTADQPDHTITFATDGTYGGTADCNEISGTYATTQGSYGPSSSGAITISPGASTLVACPEGSMADTYVAGLAAAKSYAISGTELTITLEDEGTLTFRAAE